ncbi:MAG TPA: hypothetical protein PLV89_00830 [Treponemataceae bacterium]|nr:hypothetical protein [Treponemataceae bacterium]
MKKLYPLLCSILILTAVFSCKNEPIFYGIDKEINLEDPVVLGIVYTITEAGDKLYAANGKIFSKKSSDLRAWAEESKPEGFIIRTAADSTYLYALNSENILFSTPIAGSPVWVKTSDSIIELFDNNALNASDKKAFAVKADAVYVLTDGSVSSAVSDGGASKDSLTAEFINGRTYFSSSIQFTSDREGFLYRIASSGIEYSTDNSSWTLIPITIESPMSLEFYKTETASSLFAGTKTGIIQIPLTESIPASTGIAAPGSNADSCFGKSQVPSIFAYPFGNGVVYTASMKPDNTKNTKFWAYYPSRDNWNLE